MYIIDTGFVGSGYFAHSILNNSRLVFILLISDILALSLADVLYHCRLMNAIVHNMANIVITTISSTNVNHCFCFICNIIILLKYKQDSTLLIFPLLTKEGLGVVLT
ncbi:hypothetical protein HOG21_00585 [bacterium]|nr:hypothetical protein [bacterium]